MGDLVYLQEYKNQREKEQQDEIESLRRELRDLMEEIGFPAVPEALMYMQTENYDTLSMLSPSLHSYECSYPYYLPSKELVINEWKEDDS